MFTSENVNEVCEALGPCSGVIHDALRGVGGNTGLAPMHDWPLMHARQLLKPGIEREPNRGQLPFAFWVLPEYVTSVVTRTGSLLVEKAALRGVVALDELLEEFEREVMSAVPTLIRVNAIEEEPSRVWWELLLAELHQARSARSSS